MDASKCRAVLRLKMDTQLLRDKARQGLVSTAPDTHGLLLRRASDHVVRLKNTEVEEDAQWREDVAKRMRTCKQWSLCSHPTQFLGVPLGILV
eukprot:scaffold186397_cov16-Tisochrysis_lutea.AAC.2